MRYHLPIEMEAEQRAADARHSDARYRLHRPVRCIRCSCLACAPAQISRRDEERAQRNGFEEISCRYSDSAIGDSKRERKQPRDGFCLNARTKSNSITIDSSPRLERPKMIRWTGGGGSDGRKEALLRLPVRPTSAQAN